MATKPNRSVIGAAKLLALARNITIRTEEITEYLAANGLEAPSFSPDYSEPSDTPEYVALHSSLKTSLEELAHLIDGPKRYLRSLVCQGNDLVAFQVAFEFEFFKMVPLEGGISINELASKAGLDADRTARCVRMLATHHVFQELEPNILSHTAASYTLHKDDELRCAGHYLLDEMLQAATATSESLKASPHESDAFYSPFNTRHGITMFKYYEKHPQYAARFAKAMAGAAKLQDRQMGELRDYFPWDKLSGTIVDVGGGSGHISIALAKQFTHLNFVVQDGSTDMLTQGKTLLPPSVKSRVTFMQHDFFFPQPMQNVAAFFIRQCTHNWCDRDVVTIFKSLVPGLEGSQPGTPLLINETIMPEAGTWPPHAERALRQMDLLMLVGLGAKQRTKSEFEGLLKKADPRYEIVNSISKGPMGLLEVHLKH